MEKRTDADDYAIRHVEIGGPFSGTIENQQVVLNEDGFGYHGTRAAGTGQAGDRRQQMQKKDGEIAHAPIVSRSPNPKKRAQTCNSPRTARRQIPSTTGFQLVGRGRQIVAAHIRAI
jgi:hypothetical protein